MKTEPTTTDTLTLRGKEIEIKLGFVANSELKYFPENPRIYSIVSADEKEPTQDEIETALKRMDHVNQLVQSIKANGGLTDPILVRESDLVVLEGNSRLAAYRILSSKDPIKWGNIKCKLLPISIGDEDVFALLGEYHIIGKKDWAPYEQAGYLYRRHKKHNIAPNDMAIEMGLSTKRVSQLINVYEFMVKHNDNNVQRWSYYEEYLKHNAIKKARKENPEMDKIIVIKIKSSEISKAVDIRDKLTVVAKSPRILRDLLNDKKDFERAFENAQAGGHDNSFFAKLHKFRLWIIEDECEDELTNIAKEVNVKCIFELKKIKHRCDSLIKIIEK